MNTNILNAQKIAELETFDTIFKSENELTQLTHINETRMYIFKYGLVVNMITGQDLKLVYDKYPKLDARIVGIIENSITIIENGEYVWPYPNKDSI
jgi:hypothetical protein